MRINVTVDGEKEVMRALKKFGEEKVKKVKGEVFATALDIQREAKTNLKTQRSWDEGNLANSIMVDRVSGGMAAEVGPEAPYGPYVEHGTKKHFPPPDALEDWARRHGFDSAWPICKAIAKRGLPARPYLIPAYDKIIKGFLKRLKEIFRK